MALSLPKLTNRPPADPMAHFHETERQVRAQKTQAEERLADLRGQFVGVWSAELTEAERAKRTTQIEKDQREARLAIAAANEALELAEDQRALANRASAEIALAALKIERQDVWRKIRAKADEGPTVIAAMERFNTELRALAQLDNDLRDRERAEIARGGITDRSVATVVPVQVGLWPLVSFDSDLQATAIAIENAGRDR